MPSPLTLEQMHRLLVHAASAAQAALRGEEPPSSVAPESIFEEPAAVFVTLRRAGRLCGCIGLVRPTMSLWNATAHAARAAALDDPRFEVLPAEAVQELDLEVSILSEMEPIDPEQIVVGEHGLVLRWRGYSGLLLPQVAQEHGLDRDGFLRALCRKAGVEPDTWSRAEAQLEGFTVQHGHAPAKQLLQNGAAG